jgi:hypothetical membrane protein
MLSDSSNVKSINLRVWLFWVAMAFAIGEFMDAFNTSDVITGIVLALILAACAWWVRMRKSRIPIIILLILSALELAAVIFIYPHGNPPPAWWRLAIFIVLSAAVLVLSGVTLFQKEKKTTDN